MNNLDIVDGGEIEGSKASAWLISYEWLRAAYVRRKEQDARAVVRKSRAG